MERSSNQSRKTRPMTVAPQIRIWLAVALACIAVALVVLGQLWGRADSSASRTTMSSAHVRAESGAVLRQVEALAARFKVPRIAMRIVVPKTGETAATEIRLQVGPEFSNYEFHCALAAALSDMGVSVTGTENLRTRNTVLQIAQADVAIARVSLDMRTVPQQPRKESRH